jgi:hypothetical protein
MPAPSPITPAERQQMIAETTDRVITKRIERVIQIFNRVDSMTKGVLDGPTVATLTLALIVEEMLQRDE